MECSIDVHPCTFGVRLRSPTFEKMSSGAAEAGVLQVMATPRHVSAALVYLVKRTRFFSDTNVPSSQLLRVEPGALRKT